VPEPHRPVRAGGDRHTVDRWHVEILAYHSTFKASNGRVENTHMLAEKIRRNAHGFTNHDNYRRASSAASACNGTLSPPYESEAANHASSRRAAMPRWIWRTRSAG
jgi:hypothetical protein